VNFASYDFWKFLILCFISSRLVLAVSRVLAPEAEANVGKWCLLATGLVLMGSESWLTLGMFLWVVILGWICVVLQTAKWPCFHKNSLFGILLLAQLAPLFYYKYWNFVLNETLGLAMRNPSILIPMGLSFYTFQTIGFWVDNLRSPQARPTFLDYLNFSSFFPQIVAGPIEKRESLLPQIEKVSFRIHRSNLDSALQWIILGLAYKLIVADNLGNLSDKFRTDPGNAWHVWLECLTFAFRIYFDFAGYSFIAVGLGLLFGIQLTLNFHCPYWSNDLREFWRNWHVTLGAWLRDYIYLPLGGRRSSRWIVNILIVFLVSGIWHGAGWGFLIWGLLHGLGVAFCGLGKPWLKLGPLRWAATFAYTTAAWLFFFENDPQALQAKTITLCNPAAYSLGFLNSLPAVLAEISDTLTIAFIFFHAIAFLAMEAYNIRKNFEPYHFSRKPAICLLLVSLTVLLAPKEESLFIYFNF
jgi:alginate O-acetyltransferase complex protein AlgI